MRARLRVGTQLQRTLRIGVANVACRRDRAVSQREQAAGKFHGPGTSIRTSKTSFKSNAWNAIQSIAENDGQCCCFSTVRVLPAMSVCVDVTDFIRSQIRRPYRSTGGVNQSATGWGVHRVATAADTEHFREDGRTTTFRVTSSFQHERRRSLADYRAITVYIERPTCPGWVIKRLGKLIE